MANKQHLFYLGTTNKFIIAHVFAGILISREYIEEKGSYEEPVIANLKDVIKVAPEMGAVYLGEL